MNRSQTSPLRFSLTLLMHQFIGTAGAMVLAAMLVTIALEIPNPWVHRSHPQDVYRVLHESPYFPVQITVALALGWLLNELFAHTSMFWAWVLPYASLVYSFAKLPAVVGMTLQQRLSYFFGACQTGNQCFSQTGITLPFYVAVAY